MKVHELVKWLQAFEDQDAEVQVLVHTSGTGYYDQGGNVSTEAFNPEEHAEYTDFRGNHLVKETESFFNGRFLLLGSEDN